MDDRIFGTNPVYEALSSGREIDKIFMLEGARHSRLAQITSLAKKRGVHYTLVNRKKLDELSEGGQSSGGSCLCGNAQLFLSGGYTGRGTGKK